jgi:hypothetical protein
MENVVTVGKRIVPVEQIALIEAFDPASPPEFKSGKPFRASSREFADGDTAAGVRRS